MMVPPLMRDERSTVLTWPVIPSAKTGKREWDQGVFDVPKASFFRLLTLNPTTMLRMPLMMK